MKRILAGCPECQLIVYQSMISTRALVICTVWLFAAAVVQPFAAAIEPQEIRPDGAPNRAVWMARGTFGVMVHYILHPQGATQAEYAEDLNRTVDHFDIDYFMHQFDATGADWLIFTLGQTSGAICSPQPTVDEKNPGHTPRRDLLLEIAQQIAKRGKHLIVYFPYDGDADPCVKKALDFGTPGYTERYFEFLKYYSVKFGPLISGWWFDACQKNTDDYYQRYEAALRAGNPDTIIGWSGAEFCVGLPLVSLSDRVDYFAGEIHMLEDGKIRRDFMTSPNDIYTTPEGHLRQKGKEPRYYLPDGPFIGNAQTHCLLPIDLTFNPSVPNASCKYDDDTLVNFITAVRSVGGAVTINVPIQFSDGHIAETSYEQLVRVGQRLGFAPK